MKWTLVPLAALLLNYAQGLDAQVTVSAAVNAASYLNASLPNGNLTQGGAFVVFGKGLGPAQTAVVNAFPLPNNLAGTSVSVTVGGTTVPCIMLYTLATQVAAVVPSRTPVGSGTMVVTYNGTNSAPLKINVVAHDFGIFALNQGGSGPGVLVNAITNVVNSSSASANPGDLVDIWGTGLGPVAGDEAGGALPGNIPNLNLQVYVGTQQAQVMYAGRSGCCTGLDEIEIAVPVGVTGCAVPVYVVDGGVASNFTTMSIAESGSSCPQSGESDPSLLQIAQKNGGLRVGAVSLGRVHAYTATIDYQGDNASTYFVKIPAAYLEQAVQLPAANTCEVTQFPVGTSGAISGGALTGLDTGAVTLSGPIGPYTLHPISTGEAEIEFSPSTAAASPGLINDGTVLLPGTYTFTAAGGTVGAFTASIALPAKLNWTNRPTVPASIDRTQPLTINWTNGFAGALLQITGQSQVSQGVGAQFTCWADAAAGTYTVPAAVLSALPHTYSNSGNAQGSLDVIQIYTGPVFTPPGVDYATTSFSDGFDIGPVTYQ
ncbi:MAG TPA: hypothetical protein VK686_14930 [Bryobacteraceae bacterium]|nr:hypothetical protein [Bryobacteraceae bacterium]